MRLGHYLPSLTVWIAALLFFVPIAFARQSAPRNRIIRLLERVERVFGCLANDRSAERAARMARDTQLDFVFQDA